VQIQALVHKQSTVSGPNPITPRVLPSVHLAWAPLVAVLQDWRVPVVEAALQFLADCVCLAGEVCTLQGLYLPGMLCTQTVLRINCCRLFLAEALP
jgi:hypothetical protein